MHDTAYEHGRLFFELYGSEALHTVVELGSQDVNGSLRDHCPPNARYIGLDMIAAKGVDVVVGAGEALPIASDSVDAVVTSSAFEHDVCFWDTFLELTRILRPGGLLYVNAPSNGGFHRHPLDCWRFYPDAGVALVRWAARRGVEIELMESFVAMPKAEAWADFVAVFRKAGGTGPARKGRIADHAEALNIYDLGMQAGAVLEAEADIMPDRQLMAELETELHASETNLAAAMQTNATLSEGIAAARTETAALRHDLQAATLRIADLEAAFADATRDVEAVQTSMSWRLIAWLRRLAINLRGR